DWAADNSDCNSANGCGKIQIKAFMVAAGAETPDLRDYYDEAVDYDDLHSENWQGNPTPYQYIDIDAGPPENCGGCDFETDFVNTLGTIAFAEGNVMIFEADLIDLAGNKTTTSSDNFIVDRIPPTEGTISTIETEAPDENGISSPDSKNNVVDYWNRHNTGLRLTVPLDNDASLEGGEIYILGRKVGVDTWQVLGDYGEAIYDLSADELAAGQSIVPSSSDLLEDIETQADGDTWPDGVEEMDNFEEGVSLAFSARVYDVARNYTDFNYDYTPLVVDTTSPEIQNVTSLNTAKAYGAGETIYISVKTNEQMRAVGVGASNSTLELATGQTTDLNPLIPFRSVSNDTVYYTYATQAGESSENDDPTLVTTADRLKYAATTSLAIDGGDGVL
ncbi:MAG: hypothetical protein NZ961_23450, partial [Candidatus Poribacteria bacterium]|nr:hypothetical protein [Candidatus Poribacteria bacterium]